MENNYNDEVYDFDTKDVQDGLPLGWHKVMISGEKLLMKPENPNNPRILLLTFEAVEGGNKGLNYTQGYNCWHTNATTANIARSAIKKIAEVTGKDINAVTPAKGRVLWVNVQKQKKNDQYYEIAGYKAETFEPADANEPPM